VLDHDGIDAGILAIAPRLRGRARARGGLAGAA